MDITNGCGLAHITLLCGVPTLGIQPVETHAAIAWFLQPWELVFYDPKTFERDTGQKRQLAIQLNDSPCARAVSPQCCDYKAWRSLPKFQVFILLRRPKGSINTCYAALLLFRLQSLDWVEYTAAFFLGVAAEPRFRIAFDTVIDVGGPALRETLLL